VLLINTKRIKIWADGVPDSNGLFGKEIINECIGNISEPDITVYSPEKSKNIGVAVLVISGGGYGVVCIETEGNHIAEWLVLQGITAVVLKYRLPNGHHQIPANDARRAIRIIRYNAKEWNIDKDKIGVWGFSAGGHLASTIATVFKNGNPGTKDIIEQKSSRPNFVILYYPVISMEEDITQSDTKKNLLGKQFDDQILVKQYSNENSVTKETPPTFLLHCSDDLEVPVENSLRLYKALIEKKIPTEMIIFEKGGHGPNAFNSNPSWKYILENWLKQMISKIENKL